MAPPKQAYQDDMPYAREPLKSLYVAQRLFTTLILGIWWAAYYGVMPRSRRPRPSWSIKCCISVNFTRRVYRVTELAGVTWGVRDPDAPCSNRSLKHTRFEWVDPLPERLRSGVIVDSQVPFKRVGCFVWPKERPKIIPSCPDDEPCSPAAETSSDDTLNVDIESAAEEPVIGIFMHGGGYCHMSAHENSSTSKIPARLMKDKAFTEIHAVEYRLLQHAPFPAAVQDAAAVYAHIVQRHQRHATKVTVTHDKAKPAEEDESGKAIKVLSDYLTVNATDYQERSKNKRENDEIHARVAVETANLGCKIVLIGDSAGGNLVLALARWIRDEGLLPPPHALLLLSPSCDPSHAFPETPSSYLPRPHANTDYLVDTPEPRALLQRTFLGHNPLETMHSPYVSPASMRVLTAFYGDAFAASVADLTIAQMDTHTRRFLRTMDSAPATPVPATPVLGFSVPAGLVTGPPTFASSAASTSDGRSPTSLQRPVIASPRGLSLFSEFPRACVVLGDAERLEREVTKLVGAMERDGVGVHTVWVPDAPHDVLMMGWWDERVRDTVWGEIEDWVLKL
ncbi:alpha/beta-hydrolase [Epithele typhae]|uniref:alpha/beta-hydrolase n=1 Tax=Epithele typhae TaxID=378194 RepID=UPI0020072260|nr:alpha/beta-hydrolase [Epithele typhae]KAH9917645.1 alpha/beta-hydrolase [Epithele typhae]